MSAAALETPFLFGWPKMDDAGDMLGFCLKNVKMSRKIIEILMDLRNDCRGLLTTQRG
jgi:hypothetical protein